MESSLRAPLIVLELAALTAILALVDDVMPRVALGLLVGVLLARNALIAGGGAAAEGAPEGYGDRRHDHLFRHWVNVLLKKIREFHTVCQGVAEGGVNMAVGQLRISEIEREIRELIDQVTESAKPEPLRRALRARGTSSPDKRSETYGESVPPE
jgi:hypothetical protein